MIDLDEMAAREVRRHEGLGPSLATIEARARHRRRVRRATLAGSLSTVVLVAGAGALWARSAVSYGVDTAGHATTAQPDPTPSSSSSSHSSGGASSSDGAAAADTVTVVVPEGRWLSELLPMLAEQLPGTSEAQLREVLDSDRVEPWPYRSAGTDSWEGLLLPGSYEVSAEGGPAELLGRMSDDFALVTDELGYRPEETPLGLSPYEVVIVASIVEAEARTDGDRTRIARVIYNRLEQQLPLDIDSICIFGAGDRQVELSSELMTEGVGPYPCRQNPALPPTPITTPSVASLAAALHPEPNPVGDDGVEQPWLYYVVADAEGNHFFTGDYEEFLAQKQRALDEGLQ